MIAYADTSFLVPLYAPDTYSPEAMRRLARHQPVNFLVTPHGELELVNAFLLKVFRRAISKSHAESCQTDVIQDIASGFLQRRPLGLAVFERAQQLARRHTARLGARTGDVLHVAAALEFGVDAFFTFDKQQQVLAEAEGLVTP